MVQSEGQEKVSQLESALQDANQLLLNVKSRIASREAALKSSEEQLQASRDKGQNLRSKIGSLSSQLKAVEAQLEELQVGLDIKLPCSLAKCQLWKCAQLSES